jgi:hypothetical protein
MHAGASRCSAIDRRRRFLQDVASISGRLAELGGHPEVHEVSEEELQEAAAEVPATAGSAPAPA